MAHEKNKKEIKKKLAKKQISLDCDKSVESRMFSNEMIINWTGGDEVILVILQRKAT